jgi:predicted DNA-binding protein with PD1-like motif
MRIVNRVFFYTWVTCIFCLPAFAQEYVSPTKPAVTGNSPGVKSKLISENGPTKTYALIFSPGDEVISGITEFAIQYHISSAHFTAIGDATRAKVGWYDKAKQKFKVIELKNPAEITSLIGDIALYDNKPAVHCHITLATEDGIVHGGHLLEAYIAPTLEVMITVEPEALYKKLMPEFGVLIIDPDSNK